MYWKTSILSEVMTWSLTSGEISWFPGVEGSHGWVYHGIAGVDIITFAGNLSFEICKYEHAWTTVWNKAKTSSLIVLLGAGAALFFLCRKSEHNDPTDSVDLPPSSQRLLPKGIVKWLFEDELFEYGTDDTSQIHGSYFGPSLSPNFSHSSSNDADIENDSDDLSLNSLSVTSSPHRFLKKPLYSLNLKGNSNKSKTKKLKSRVENPVQITNPCPKCTKGTCRLKKHQTPIIFSNSSSCYSGSPKIHPKTPDFLISDDDQIIQRSVVSNRLTYRYFRPGFDLRMRGDGSDKVFSDQRSINGRAHWTSPPGSRSNGTSGLCSPACGDPSCTDSQCYSLPGITRDTSVDSVVDQTCSVSGSMLDLVQNAKDIRKMIREVSLDSEASDFDLDFPYNLGVSTSEEMDHLCEGLSRLVNNCDIIEDEIASLPGESKLISSQSSISGFSEIGDEGPTKQEEVLKRDSSIPDFRTLQKKARSNKRLWKLTGFSDADRSMDLSEHDNASLEWDSPLFGWDNRNIETSHEYNEGSRTDSKDDIVSVVGSSLDPWEWDSDCLHENLETDVIGMKSQNLWLEGSLKKLDIELFQDKNSSLCEGTHSSSRRSLTDKEMMISGRPPLFGCSSIRRDSFSSQRSDYSTVSDDFTLRSAKRYTWIRSNSNSKLMNELSQITNSNIDNPRKQMTTSTFSEESGFHEYEGSMTSSMTSSMNSNVFTASINLSPVKEANEPQPAILLNTPPSNLPKY